MATSPQVETVSTGIEKVRLAAAVALLVGGVAGYYLLQAQGMPVRVGVLLLGVALALLAFFTSDMGKRLIAFGRDSWREVGKVVWPTSKEATQMTLYVFAFVVVMALFLWLTDKTLEWVLYDLVLGWRK